MIPFFDLGKSKEQINEHSKKEEKFRVKSCNGEAHGTNKTENKEI